VEPKILRRCGDHRFRRRNCLAALYDQRFSVAIVTARRLACATLNKLGTTVLENQKIRRWGILAVPSMNRGQTTGGLAQSPHDDFHCCSYVVPVETVRIQVDALKQEIMGMQLFCLAHDDASQHGRSG
jgi:hypothetical protein